MPQGWLSTLILLVVLGSISLYLWWMTARLYPIHRAYRTAGGKVERAIVLFCSITDQRVMFGRFSARRIAVRLQTDGETLYYIFPQPWEHEGVIPKCGTVTVRCYADSRAVMELSF